MKPTTRGTLAAVITGVAAAIGAATPAVATGAVPVPVPLEGAENSLGMELPEIGADVPLLKPGTPNGPRYAEGRLLPDRTVPQLPVRGGLPGLSVRQPLPQLLGDGFDHAGVEVPAADLRTLSPGLDVDTPLTAPGSRSFGLPGAKLPEAGVLAPVVQAVPAAHLGLGAGL
ncbi:hypothetical protein AB0M97_19100 [Streptomyces sp. NPDC051207]|uniref:hypothetical protein n=1 Tax=Streptomyces sp. NPDC051207 TaxID=3154641 RepID=UPI0034123330